ncbi:MAG: hypothetical protein V4526_02215 [Patescibacteria group bacterium]
MKSSLLKISIAFFVTIGILTGSAAPALAQTANTPPTTTSGGAGIATSLGGAAFNIATLGPVLGNVKNLLDNANKVPGGMDVVKRWTMGGLAWIMNQSLATVSTYLRITGTLLSMSMYVTLHISELVNNNTGIESVWKTIRDFSSIFFIFLLLFASIRIILGFDGGKFKKLVTGIVICGLLINFSLFFVKVVVDASNVVALSFYNAITPGMTKKIDPHNALTWFKWGINDQGLGDVFMDSLKITSIYDVSGEKWSKDLEKKNTHTQIIIAGVFGSILMITAGTVFGVAAFMMIARVAILIMVMVFSPIYFIAMVFPDMKKYANQLKDLLIGQAIFAPIFMILIYVTMKIMTAPKFTQFMGTNDPSTTLFSAILGAGGLGAIFQYIIVMTLLTTSLAAAKGFAGKSGDWADKAFKAVRAGAAQYSGLNWATRNAVGGTAARIDDRLSNTWAGNTRFGRSVRETTVGKLADTKIGGTSFRQFEKDWKATDKNIKDKNRDISSTNKFNLAMKSGNFDAVKTAMKDLGGQKSKLRFDQLTNFNVLKNLKKGDFEAIYKREDLSKEQIDKIKDYRLGALADALGKTEKDAIENMVTNMTGEDLADLQKGDVKLPNMTVMKKNLLTDNKLIEHLTQSQLKDMENMDMAIKDTIGSAIVAYTHPTTSKPHKAFGYIEKNEKLWMA